MSLDIGKLKNVVRRDDRTIIAQCPACAAKGNDMIGRNHLIVYPNGSYGCALYPGVQGNSSRERTEHLRAIFKVVGVKDGAEKPVCGPVYACVPFNGKSAAKWRPSCRR